MTAVELELPTLEELFRFAEWAASGSRKPFVIRYPPDWKPGDKTYRATITQRGPLESEW